jgi:hypothetical protein
MRKLLAACLLVLPAMASTIDRPTLATDGLSVDLSVPEIGASVFDVPGSTWQAWFEDTAGLGDRDFNDTAVQVHFQGDGAAQLARLGGVTSTDAVLLPLPLLEPGQEVTLSLVVPSQGWVWQTGPGSRNSDGLPHAWVARIEETPEPNECLAVALALLVLGRRR